jgi:putative addiction module component (TIGR02574 family)
MTETISIEKLSLEQRLDLLDRVWTSLTADDTVPEIPEWHRRELLRRIERADNNPDESLTLEEARRRVFGEHRLRIESMTPNVKIRRRLYSD